MKNFKAPPPSNLKKVLDLTGLIVYTDRYYGE